MIDASILRRQPGLLEEALRRRGIEDIDVDELRELDRRRREVRAEAESLRAGQRRLGKQIASSRGDEKQQAISRAGQLSEDYKQSIGLAEDLDGRFEQVWSRVPNLPDDSVPMGEGEQDNVEIKRWGEPRRFDFPVRDHLELGEALGVIDMERATKVSGSRFAYLAREAVQLELALVRWALDRLVQEGFVPVVPPVLVREEGLFGTGFFPRDRDQVYAVEQDDLFLVGTSEVSLAAMHMDEIFPEEALPLRYSGFSSCFRREAGTYGRDTRGIFRVHQFDKLEMFSFCHPDRSLEEHEFLLSLEEALLQALGIPYRVVNVCTGDLGPAAAKKYDIEAWIPSQGAYREITSCSNTTDYQARRLHIRYRAEEENRMVHTLNGTAVAVGRTLLAILENYQREDGSVAVPEALRPHLGFDEIRR
ncbi:MAG: serine--tRNA ligase [Actinomycetota bacterium]|nr:serine--tRNA ligase [Actinomycetota bacterium]